MRFRCCAHCCSEGIVTPPNVIWFKTQPLDLDEVLHLARHHAFEVRPDGTVDPESCCGKVMLDPSADDGIADEPARAISEFDKAPACATCLAVAELELPGSSVSLLS